MREYGFKAVWQNPHNPKDFRSICAVEELEVRYYLTGEISAPPQAAAHGYHLTVFRKFREAKFLAGRSRQFRILLVSWEDSDWVTGKLPRVVPGSEKSNPKVWEMWSVGMEDIFNMVTGRDQHYGYGHWAQETDMVKQLRVEGLVAYRSWELDPTEL